jgi:Amt family ammonium transporter
MAAIALGPRKDRFDEEGNVKPIRGHDTIMSATGVLILWLGWFGFNGGSVLAFDANGASELTGKVIVNTIISAAAACVSTAVITYKLDGYWNVEKSLNAIIGGLVGITAGCATVNPWHSVIIGFVSALVYLGAASLLLRLRIDDPLEAVALHGACGVWGCLAVGIFSTRQNIATAYGYDNDAMVRGEQFGVQLVGVLAIIAWTAATSGLLFFTMKAAGILRVPDSEEIAGLDVTHHGHSAYDMEKTASEASEEEMKEIVAADEEDVEATVA